MTDASSHTLRFLPVGLCVHQRNCLVVGGGRVGTRKVLTLCRAGAKVTVVSPTVSGELARKIPSGDIRWVKETFREEHLENVFLAIAATDDEALNETVVRLAVARGVLVCDASSAERSQVIFAALLQHDQVTVAVFSDGRNPSDARQTRDRIENALTSRRLGRE